MVNRFPPRPIAELDRSAPAQPPTEGTEGTAPGGGPPGPPPNMTSNRRLQQTQAQVEEVVDIMRVNVDKVLERDQKLSELDDRADALQAGASQFESSAAKLKRKYWWKNCKMMIMLGAICAIIVVVIVRRARETVFPPSVHMGQVANEPPPHESNGLVFNIALANGILFSYTQASLQTWESDPN
ncbi:vesicle-associated membrane protein 1-like [Sciurus carolinensis]|uniref:vesicle-associated membrane protein 1-like n=1 Tax=Sciurus carolinensis TaxID=30640 RepID=UPI001FB2F1C6|nr:vesicle-associated membrane protein 1-like [Sciurus carolinensis]